jgi:SAM-dependent methyltransferase
MTTGSTGSETAEQHWDGLYRQHGQRWSGNPNAALVTEVTAMVPGRALDLGCGEGGDAVWLAAQGWLVLGVDISQLALDRAAVHAASAGVADRISWARHDLAHSFPDGSFDLVSAQFLHSAVDMPREAILRRAATAVAPGGVLLVVGHADVPPWGRHDSDHAHHHDLPSAVAVLASLDLPPGEWTTLRAAERSRDATGPDGERAVLTDSVLVLRRVTS